MLLSNRYIIAIGGPKGVGKSTLLKSLHSHYPHLQIIPVGSELKRVARAEFHKSFLSLPLHNRRAVRNQFARSVVKMQYSVILDMHFGEFEDEGYPCIIPPLLQKYITQYVLLTASPSTLYTRRHQRTSTSRLDLASITMNIYGEKIIYQELVKRYGVPGCVVENENEAKSVTAIKRLFKRIGII